MAGVDVLFSEVALADVVAILVAEGVSFGVLSGLEQQVGVIKA